MIFLVKAWPLRGQNVEGNDYLKTESKFINKRSNKWNK